MDAVDAPLFNTVRAHLLAETGGIARQRLRQILFVEHGIDKPADHGVLARADQVQVLALDFIHHVLHLGKAHHAGDDFAADHEGRDEIGEAAADHEIAGIGENCGGQPRDIAFQIVKAVAAGLARAVQVYPAQALHDIHVIGDFKVGHGRFAEALHFDVLAVVPADGHGLVDNIGDDEHPLADLFRKLRFKRFKRGQLRGDLAHFGLGALGLVPLAFRHQAADALADRIALAAQIVAAGLGVAELPVEVQHLVDEDELVVLKLFADIILYQFGVVSQQFDVQHTNLPFIKKESSIPMGRKIPRCHPNYRRCVRPVALRRGTGRLPSGFRRPLEKRKQPPPPPGRTSPRLS